MVSGFLVVNCNAPHTLQLRTILPHLVSNVPSIVADIKHGIASRHGFRSFFKSNDNKKDVQAVFESIAHALPIFATHPDVAGLRPPTILCYDRRGTDEVDARNYREDCVGKAGSNFISGASSMHSIASVALCDLFWLLPTEPTIEQCPIITGNRRYRKLENAIELVKNQYSILIHEFTHLYNKHDPPYDYAETYGLQGSIDLNATESLKNPANYAYYAAGSLCP